MATVAVWRLEHGDVGVVAVEADGDANVLEFDVDAWHVTESRRSVQDRDLPVLAQLGRTKPGESASVRHRTPRRKAVQSALP